MSGFVEKCRSEEMGRRPYGLIEWGCLLEDALTATFGGAEKKV
jgi:hypothetical protein